MIAPGPLVDLAGAIAIVALGAALLFVRPRQRANVAFGVFTIAARPIERALEARHHRSAPPASTAKEEAYRKALRFALRDRRLSRDEELHLHDIAEQIGITGRRAHELLVEVEREAADAREASR